MNGLAKNAIVALLASALFLSLGCGAKSGKSRGPVSGTGSQPTDTSESPESDAQHAPDDDRFSPDNERTPSPQIPHEEGEVIKISQQQNEQQGEVIKVDGTPIYEGDYEDDYDYEEDYGKQYDVIEKDQIYGEDTQLVGSGERFGEFGAVMFDDPMWYPGLPDYPAGHPNSKISKIYTGGVSESGYKFTDGKSDELMASMVQQFNNIGVRRGSERYHENVKEESKKLANRIKNVKMEVDAYSTGSIKLEVQFVDGDASNPVNTLFHGKLNANPDEGVHLDQVNIKGDKDLKFSAQVFCRDQDGGCQNLIIELSQWKDGKICRMAHIVYRSGDAHITMSESDRLHYSASPNISHQRLAEYISNTTYNACQVNKKRKDIPNRLTQHLLAYCGDGAYTKLPAAKTIGYETWAAAYGASGFRLTFEDKAHWTGYDTNGRTTISGPLVHATQKNPIFSERLNVQGTLCTYIKSAHLVNNDGGGNINLLLRLNGQEEAEMRLSVTSMIRNTIYQSSRPVERPVEIKPEDPRG